MKMGREIRTIDAFMDGKVFAIVNTTKGVDELFDMILKEDKEAVDRTPKEYRDDFEKKLNTNAYYLTYYRKQHSLKAMTEEFFNTVYTSANGLRRPYIFRV